MSYAIFDCNKKSVSFNTYHYNVYISKGNDYQLIFGLRCSKEKAMHASQAYTIYHTIEGKNAFGITNTYYLLKEQLGIQTLQQLPRPAPVATREADYFSGTPLSVYNRWPEQVSNQSLFAILLGLNGFGAYPEFIEFVKTWYQCSCAIIYDLPIGDPKIIGSGNLMDNAWVATARHNFNDLPMSKLYVRFFNYRLSLCKNGFIKVQETYIDVPVTKTCIAERGIDAGYLQLATIIDNRVLPYYNCQLPQYEKTLASLRIPSGSYILFHFAGGMPHVSIGENVKLVDGSCFLYDNVTIQAGPGASGSVMLAKHFDRVFGVGISIYRYIEAGHYERRVINFGEFNDNAYLDCIAAPYAFKENNILSAQFDESSYEFLNWRDEVYVGQRADKPNTPIYLTQDHHSVHHIVPIADLLFLWDYLHSLARDEINQIKKHVAEATAKQKAAITKQQYADLHAYYGNQEPQYQRENHKATVQQIKNTATQFMNNLQQQLITQELQHQYARFYKLLDTLCPEDNVTRTGFAWSWWNVFKGWERDYRTDDPSHHKGIDFSEKIKPATFNLEIWNCLKIPSVGLYYVIQELKRKKKQDSAIENKLYQSLLSLTKVWKKIRHKTIHDYTVNDWLDVGNKHGHKVYCVKQ